MKAVIGALALAMAGWSGAATAAPLRVMALDQCADQFVLALAPDAELALSPRADDPDSWMRAQADGRRRVRPTLEAAVGFRPDVAVRYWGGDARLLAALERDGVRTVTIADASDMDGVRANIRAVAQALRRPERGEALVRRMETQLERAGGAGRGRKAVYVTAGGFTTGPGSLMDAVLRAAGFRNGVERVGYQPLGLERVLLTPPALFVKGFFDLARSDWRGAGRHPVMRRAMQGRTAAELPGAVLTCPAWFAGDAVAALAEQAS
ncbi:Hemin-binding periplasmic protein HmuT precursor [compost metagenome]